MVLLGLGLLLGLFRSCLHLESTWDKVRNSRHEFVTSNSSVVRPRLGTLTVWAHLVGLGVSVLRVVLLVRLCLSVLLRLLGLLVLLLIVHRLLFL